MKISPLSLWKQLFFLLLLAIYASIGLYKTLELKPQSVHQWAQCDRASVANIFGTETLNIFRPQTHNIENGSGVTGMEFPIINYTVGIFYRVIGYHEYIFRLLMSIIVICGLMAAYEIAHTFSNNPITSGLLVLCFSFSPVLMYYTPNFLPDAASMGFIMIAWMYFFRLKTDFKRKDLLLLGLFSLIATLIKISSFLSIITIILILVLDNFNFFKSKERNQIFSKGRLPVIVTMVMVIFAVVAWYYYASWLSRVSKSNVFLLQAKITFSPVEIVEHIKFISNLWWLQYYSKIFYYTILISSAFILVFRKHAPKLLATITLLLWMGTLCFAFLMLSQFRDHDYYIITLLPVTLFHLLLFSKVFVSVFESKVPMNIIVLNIFLVVLASNGFLFCKENFGYRYSQEGWMSSPAIFNKYNNLHQKLKEIGIPDNAKVISIADDSPNISLYLMNYRGITVSKYEDEHSIEEKIGSQKGDNSYIILNDSSYFEKKIVGLTDKPVIADVDGIYIIKND